MHALFMKFKFQTNVQIFSTSFCATLFRIKFFSRKTYDFLFWEINAWPANIFTICHSYSWPMKSVLHNSVFSCSWICFVFCFHIFSLFYLWYLGWNRNQYLLGHLNICFIFFLQTIRFHESQLFWKKWNENYRCDCTLCRVTIFIDIEFNANFGVKLYSCVERAVPDIGYT